MSCKWVMVMDKWNHTATCEVNTLERRGDISFIQEKWRLWKRHYDIQADWFIYLQKLQDNYKKTTFSKSSLLMIDLNMAVSSCPFPSAVCSYLICGFLLPHWYFQTFPKNFRIQYNFLELFILGESI